MEWSADCTSVHPRAVLQRAAQVEQLLLDQLCAAVGKELGPQDFGEYMDFHYRQLFRPAFAPSGSPERNAHKGFYKNESGSSSN